MKRLSRGGKSDTTRDPNTTNPFINKSWVEAKQVRVDMANSFNKQVMFILNMRTRLTCLAFKSISFCYYFYFYHCLIYGCNYMFITIFMVVIVF